MIHAFNNVSTRSEGRLLDGWAASGSVSTMLAARNAAKTTPVSRREIAGARGGLGTVDVNEPYDIRGHGLTCS